MRTETPPLEQTRARQSRFLVLEAALASFRAVGYDATTYKEIAGRAGVSPALVGRYFPAKELLALAAYHRLADALSARVVELHGGTVAARFTAVMAAKLELLERDRDAYLALAGRALDRRAREGVLAASTEGVRARVMAIFRVVVDGADDAPDEVEARARLCRALYGAHLLAVLVWTQTSPERARDVVDVMGGALTALGPAAAHLLTSQGGAQMDALARELLDVPAIDAEEDRARAILRRLLRSRRLLRGAEEAGAGDPTALHLPLVRARIGEKRPLELVLPAFPAKAPNLKKVLGKRPDAAEEVALRTLAELVRDVEALHAPGATLVICSDGHVFADAVGVSDADVTAYRHDFEGLAREVLGHRVRIFGLTDIAPRGTFAERRAWLLATYGEPAARIEARAAASPRVRAQVDGIHRFLTEDARGADPALSRSQAQKRTRALSVEVVRRSEAWGRLVSTVFPGGVRLSIHPQPAVSEKIGVHLVPTEDAWLTPWHGVALYEADRVTLVHRADAEARGAVVVHEGGRPWAMRLP